MSLSEEPNAPAVPNILIPKALGWLNILFGFALMIFGTCCAAGVPLSTTFDDWIRNQQARVQTEFKERHANEIKALEKQRSEATSDEDKASIDDQIKDAKNTPPPVIDFGTNNLGLKDPMVLGHFTLDAISGLVLNLLMFVSGFGLLRYREWGRKLAIGVAGLKLIRLLVLTASLLFLVEPRIVAKAGAWLTESSIKMAVEANDEEEKPFIKPEEAAQITADLRSMLTGLAFYILVLGVVYPTLLLSLLTRRGARNACLYRSIRKPSSSPTQPPPEAQR